MKKASASLKALVLLAPLLSATADAAIALEFSGGSGAPLSITIVEPVMFTVNVPQGVSGSPAFLIEDIGEIFAGFTLTGLSGDVTFTVNSGAPVAMSSLYGGLNAVTPDLNDLLLTGATSSMADGDVIILSAGTLTTNAAVAAAAPTAGDYNMYFYDMETMLRAGTDGTTVPEPSAAVLAGLAGAGIALRRRRR